MYEVSQNGLFSMAFRQNIKWGQLELVVCRWFGRVNKMSDDKTARLKITFGKDIERVSYPFGRATYSSRRVATI
jgi:hypothetical protein